MAPLNDIAGGANPYSFGRRLALHVLVTVRTTPCVFVRSRTTPLLRTSRRERYASLRCRQCRPSRLDRRANSSTMPVHPLLQFSSGIAARLSPTLLQTARIHSFPPPLPSCLHRRWRSPSNRPHNAECLRTSPRQRCVSSCVGGRRRVASCVGARGAVFVRRRTTQRVFVRRRARRCLRRLADDAACLRASAREALSS